MGIVFLVLVWFSIAVTVASLVPLNDWWIRAFDFPRLQICMLSLVAFVGFLFFFELASLLETLSLMGLGLCLVFQGSKIYPYVPIASKQVLSASAHDDDMSLFLLVANVRMENRQAQQLLQIVYDADPDILLLVETDAWWEQRLCGLEDDYKYIVKQVQDNFYGMILYSRLELVNPDIRFLVKADIPSIHTRVVLPSGQQIWLHGLHPEPPSPSGAKKSTERDAELLIVGQEVKKRDEATIVAGDLNDVAWSYITTLFQKTSGLLDPRIGRGMYNSYHAQNILMRWPLDHVFHSNHFLLIFLRRLPAFGSDHFPMYIALSLKPQAEHFQDEPEVDTQERQRVEEKIESVDQNETFRRGSL